MDTEKNSRFKQRTPEESSAIMKKVKNKGSQIETVLQKELWSRGLRYRKNVTSVEGKPDICFMSLKIAVFCDSEFWHGYNWAERKNDFKTNREFWIPKIERNIERDKEVVERLLNNGWIVLRYWGARIKKDPKGIADEIEKVYRERKKGYDKI